MVKYKNIQCKESRSTANRERKNLLTVLARAFKSIRSKIPKCKTRGIRESYKNTDSQEPQDRIVAHFPEVAFASAPTNRDDIILLH